MARQHSPAVMKLGAKMVQQILGMRERRTRRFTYNRKRHSYCIRYGFIAQGFRLPQRRPAHPMISAMPQMKTVGIHHQTRGRYHKDWKRWTAGDQDQESSVRKMRTRIANTLSPVVAEYKQMKRAQTQRVGMKPKGLSVFGSKGGPVVEFIQLVV